MVLSKLKSSSAAAWLPSGLRSTVYKLVQNDHNQVADSTDSLGQDHIPLTALDVQDIYSTGSWQRDVWDAYSSTLQDEERQYPCVYASQGFARNEQRYLFLSDPTADSNLTTLSAALSDYVQSARAIGPNTSFVVFTPPETTPSSLEQYHAQFWQILSALHSLDSSPWPENIPEDLDTDNWCFCYSGEPVFAVGLTPAYSRRASRYSPSFALAFQPKWVFDRIFRTPRMRQGATAKVRKLLAQYDEAEVSPDLGAYGESGLREYRQYFLMDDNVSSACPFAALNETK